MKIYIAGPYTADTPEEVLNNVHNAIETGNKVSKIGFTPFIPHLAHYWNKLYYHDYEFWMDWCFEWIPTCDAILVYPPSPGANREETLAEELGIPIYYSIEELIKYELT